MIDDKKFALKTKFEREQELERQRLLQRLKAQQETKFNSFGFHDFLFFFIVIIVSILCKVIGGNLY